jgi:hypothetical protein
MKRTALISALCISVFSLFFCGVYRSDVEKEKYLELGRAPQFESVGRVLQAKDEKLEGSCVLIDSNHVLSAAHVFIENETRPDTVNANGQKVVIYTPINVRVGKAANYLVELGGKTYRCKALMMHPAYLDSTTKGSCDLAMLELETPVTNVSPALLNTGFDELHANVVGVGYGSSGPAFPVGNVNRKNEKIGGENIIDTIGDYMLNGRPTMLMADFDSPTNPELNAMGDSTPLTLEYGVGGGDSGGGLFRKNGDHWELIGICSGSSYNVRRLLKFGYYGEIMTWTRVSAFKDWIDEVRKQQH